MRPRRAGRRRPPRRRRRRRDGGDPLDDDGGGVRPLRLGAAAAPPSSPPRRRSSPVLLLVFLLTVATTTSLLGTATGLSFGRGRWRTASSARRPSVASGRTSRSSLSSPSTSAAAAAGEASSFRRTTPRRRRDASSLFAIEGGGGGIGASGIGASGGRTLSARRVLHPEIYLGDGSPLTTTPGREARDEPPVPLSSGLRLLVRSLESILEAHSPSSSSSNDESILLDHLDAASILRIEAPISGANSIDPLCWMHAQRPAMDALRRKLHAAEGRTSKNGDGTLPAIYFGDAEGNAEAAAVGKASPSHSDSWDPFAGKRIWDNVNGNAMNGDESHDVPHMFKEGELPPGARVYGGSRFDWKHYDEKKRGEGPGGGEKDDWDGFGGDRGGYWILPAVELRRETAGASGGRDEGAERRRGGAGRKSVTLAVHLHNLSPASLVGRNHDRREHHRRGWRDAASHVLSILRELTDELSPAVPCTTLPPVLTRSESTKGRGDDGDSGLAFERGVKEALRRIKANGDRADDLDGIGSDINGDRPLRKVVLARKVDLNLGACVSGLDVLMRMKFGGHIGHLFYLNPGDCPRNNILANNDHAPIRDREFLGCTPERLFRVDGSGSGSGGNGDRIVTSEALAGTRIRGQTPSADNELLRELLSSRKDMLENEITGQFIRRALSELEGNGWLEKSRDDLLTSYDYKGDAYQNGETSGGRQRYFVRRLRNLQHICQTFEGKLSKSAHVIDVSRSLLRGLHPTPAVCGDGPDAALEFIRKYETLGFDRGYYAGPFGYIGHDSADVVVAIRSALVTNYRGGSRVAQPSLRQFDPPSQGDRIDMDEPASKVSVFGGAGIVDGSTVQGEWTEISHKVGVLSSLFPPSPITLQGRSTPNVAWSTAFVEELVRCGVTQFYVCPGSRSTPLTAAIFKSTRSNVGVVRAISVHDERGAGFRAVGYARRTGRPAAVVTSSGTAVANLYPSIVEASNDGVPLLLLTADRPYENRDNGSNQSVDQVKMFSASYVRWHRDVPPPSDDVPVSLALSDANHAVAMSRQLMGPVHLNLQFRENLAPDGGPIRGDDRIGSATEFHNLRFTDVPGFARWSRGGNRWQDAYYPKNSVDRSVLEVTELILNSRRGVVVAGNLRGDGTDLLSGTIAHFAASIGFPVLAGVQSGALRRERAAVPYAEHLLKNPLVSNGMRPDLVIQLGHPLISTEISKIIRGNPSARHVLVHPSHPNERADPEFTVTHRISSNVRSFLNDLMDLMEGMGSSGSNYGSELAPLLYLGRELQQHMPSIIREASSELNQGPGDAPAANGEANAHDDDGGASLTEPEVMLAISQVLGETASSSSTPPMSLFLSNSMPVRDGEAFLYPSSGRGAAGGSFFPPTVSVNRGASGIDGIVSTATGCGDTSGPTTLVCGDVTALHDLNALYGLTKDDSSSNNAQSAPNGNGPPLTTVIVNNGGGAIFSFLPISKHGGEVGFEEYWGTPTRNFSFERGASAFGLPYESASSFEAFKDAYRSGVKNGGAAVIEARVVGRSTNVDVHQRIAQSAVSVIDKVLGPPPARDGTLPVKTYHDEGGGAHATSSKETKKTLLLIHGWMGDKSEWDLVGETLSGDLSEEWNIISIDLPGHGESSLVLSSDQQVAHSSLGLDAVRPFGPARDSPFSLDMMARAVCRSLIRDHGVERLDAIAGYSLGGRIALAMKRLYSTSLSSSFGKVARDNPKVSTLITDETRMILLGSSPGKLPSNSGFGGGGEDDEDDARRLSKDLSLAESLFSSAYRSYLTPDSPAEEDLAKFLTKWYGVDSLWGDLRKRHPRKYRSMLEKRLRSLKERRRDIASVLYGCSPPLASGDDWKACVPSKTLFVAGELDGKYSAIGRAWEGMRGVAKYVEVANAGHALLVEEPRAISSIINGFVNYETMEGDKNAMDIFPTTVDKTLPPAQDREEESTAPLQLHQVGTMEFDAFSITVGRNDGSERGVRGIGWGDAARLGSELKRREGFIVSIASRDGMAVGVGEVSPLEGLHEESLGEAGRQLRLIREHLASNVEGRPEFDAARVLSLDGSLSRCIDDIFGSAGIDGASAAPSVRSGLEMAVLSVSSQLYGTLLPQALAANYWRRPRSTTQPTSGQLPISGFVPRGNAAERANARWNEGISFPSYKVKVGHGDPTEDALHLIRLKESSSSSSNGKRPRFRADANRAWDVASARAFVDELRRAGDSALDAIEFVEEPLEAQTDDGGRRDLGVQVAALEAFADGGGLGYALDETLADLAVLRDRDFDWIAADLRGAFGGESAGRTGCVAFVLKPALLGLELSMRIAKLARGELGIAPVFSSSFDSGIGLAYAAILAAVADDSPRSSSSSSSSLERFSHGLGTFGMLRGDTLSPPFESYVSEGGSVNVPSLSRALYGLSLDEMSDRLPTYETASTTEDPTVMSTESNSYLATTSSTSGRDITVSVSLPLPFSDGVASSRFTDLPQMSRWSPWLNSVTYLDESPGLTEWNLNIRGVRFSWKASSRVLTNPRGIAWESVSGLKNRGVVEFEPTTTSSDDGGDPSCVMRLRMSVIVPRVLVSLFRGMPSGVHEFLQDKLLKWSLEMFRDVVKADLALERGDQELGDALFGAVEGRANALEEALK